MQYGNTSILSRGVLLLVRAAEKKRVEVDAKMAIGMPLPYPYLYLCRARPAELKSSIVGAPTSESSRANAAQKPGKNEEKKAPSHRRIYLSALAIGYLKFYGFDPRESNSTP